MLMRRHLLSFAGAVAFAGVACSSDGAPGVYLPDEWSTDAGSDVGLDTSAPSPEDERFELSAPAASARYVWVANATRGTLARIDASSGAIRIETVRVGADPRAIVARPDDDAVAVLNHGSGSVTWVEAGAAGEGNFTATADVIEGANRLVVAPNGELAFAWYDNQAAEPGDAPGELSTVSAVRLADVPTSYQLSVGLNVRDVFFSEDGTRAYVVADEGVSIIPVADVDSDGFYPPVPSAIAGEDIPIGAGRETVIADSQGVALVRFEGHAALRVVDLVRRSARDIELPEALTDIDLLADGTAVLAMRDHDQLGLLDLEALAAEELAPIDWIDANGASLGQSVPSPDGTTMLLFSSAEASTIVGVFDGTSRTVSPLNVRKGVRGAAFAPDGRTAVIYHTKEPGEPQAGAPPEEILARAFALSLVDIATTTSKLVLTDGDPGELAFTADGGAAFAILPGATRQAVWADLRTFATDVFSFERPLEHVGLVPSADLVFVSMTHDLGRIAFIDIESGELREITGFELNSLIE